MSRRFLGAILAFELFAVSGLSAQELIEPTFQEQPVADAVVDQGTTGDENYIQAEQPLGTDIPPPLNGIEAAIRDLTAEGDKDQREREAQQQREMRDLEAQEAMAVWAKGMFWASFATVVLTLFTVVITFFALIAVIRTLKQTRRAADYAQDMVNEAKATTAAAVQAALATEAANAQSAVPSELGARAYLAVKDVTIGFKEGKAHATVYFTLQNAGKSIAFNVQAVKFVRSDPGVGLGDYHGRIPDGSHEFPLVSTLIPGASEVCEVPIFMDQTYDSNLNDVKDGTADHVEIMVVYQTVFDRPRKVFSGEIAICLDLDFSEVTFEDGYGERLVESFSASHRPSWMNGYLSSMEKRYEHRIFVQS